MLKSNNFLLRLACMLMLQMVTTLAQAQVTVANAHASSNGTYTTLKGAFDAINGQSQTGNSITITITASTTETAAAVLNAGDWTSLTMYPNATGLSISGGLSGTPLIDLNGADNVTIDGRVNATGSTVDLTITNTSTGATGTSTIRYINDASGNTVQYCLIKGASTDESAGVLFFSTAAAGGNDNNSINNNNITADVDANRPRNIIFSSGTAANENNGNSITNNNIYNFFSRSGTGSQAIMLSANTTAWVISGNSFYETASFTPTATTPYSVIYINNTSGISFRINDNYIGGRAASCGGSAWTKTGSSGVQNNTFYGIRCNVGTSDSSRIYNNRIQNWSWTNAGAAVWYGFAVEGGQVNIGNSGGNRIGDTTGTGNIVYTAGAVSPGGNIYGIYVSGSGNVNIRFNLMGSTTAANSSSSISSSFYGIAKTAVAGTLTIRNNFIGSAATVNSIRCSSASSSFTSAEATQVLCGVYSTGTGLHTIEDNSICNLTNSTSNISTGIGGLCRGVHVQGFASGSTINNNAIKTMSIASANTSQPLSGIYASNSGATITIRGNSIVGLTNTFSNYTGNFSGIYLFALNNQNSTVSQNFISNLSISSPSTSSVPNIQAIYGLSTDVIVSNNIITINNNTTTTYYGIRINSSSSSDESVLFNTIYFTGTQSATASANSRCIWMSGSSSSSTFHYVYNNLLHNARTNSGSATGTHTAVHYDFSTNVFSNYNNYFVNGTGGVVGYWPSSNRTTLADLQAANSQDGSSTNINVVFTNAGGSTAGSYLPTSAAANLVLVANRITSVTTDYTGATRSFYSMGAYDFAVNQPLVQVTATAGTATADYTSLKLALDAINAGTHQGTVEVKIATSLSDNQSAILYQSGYNSTSSYTSLAIYPTAANLVYEASLAGVLLDLNGADNVTLDGRVNRTGSTVALTLLNSSTSSSANTIRFINGAQSNTIRYTSIKGGSTGGATGLINFSISSSGSNSSNIIEYCTVSGLSSTSRVRHAIYSSGSASPNGNNSNTIRYNEISNFFIEDGLGGDVTAVGIYSNSSEWTITDNSFFLPSTISLFNGSYHVVYINNTSGVNFQVNNNFIGGTSANCGGGTFTITSGRNFWGIRLNVGTSTVSNIQGNTFRKISYSADGYKDFILIETTAGNVNIGNTTGNVLGDSSTTGSIIFNRGYWFSSPQTANFYGINILSGGTINCRNNIIAGINIGPANYNQHVNFVGIRNAPSSGSNSATISNNFVGAYNTPNSINIQNTAEVATTVQECYGILTTGGATMNDNLISNLNNATNNTTTTDAGRINGIRCTSGTQSIQRNTIRNLSIANASTSTTQDASVGGIVISGAGAHTLTANIITGLTNSNSSFAGNIHGLYLVGTSSASNITRNFIQGLAATGASSVSATLYGIRHISGQATYTNNIVAFGNNNPGTLYGIFDAGAASSALNLYHNTIYLGGSPGSGALNSFAFYSNTATNARNHRNNIFANARSNNGASGTHYAAFFNYAVSTNLTLDFNNYFAGGTGGILGGYNSANITSLPLIAGLDASSKNLDPLFTNPGGLKPSDYKPAQKGLIGLSISGITTDYTNATRNYYSIGAHDPLVFSQWTGNTSSIWTTTSNWASGATPPSTAEVQFSATAGRDLILDANRTIKALYFNGASRKFVLGNFNLTVDSIITGGAASSYVQTNGTGVINKTISNSSTFEFQAGNASYNPVGITNNTGSSDNFDVRVQDEVYNQGSSGTLLTTPRVAATWIINKNSGTSNTGNGVDFTFGFDATQKKSGLNNDNDIRLYHYGSVWTKQSAAGSISLSGSTYSYSYPQYKGSFSPFSLGDDIVLLPASWMAFGCNREEQNRTVVSWTVSDEKQVASYTVERSLNGARYDSIGSLSAVGNVAGIQRYEFLDKNAPSTPAYYRIVQMEISGDYSLSNPCFSRPPQNKTVTAVDIYPNPANRQIVITGADPEHILFITMYDVSGKNILKVHSQGGKAQFDTADIPAGVYYINIVGTGIHINRKVLINH